MVVGAVSREDCENNVRSDVVIDVRPGPSLVSPRARLGGEMIVDLAEVTLEDTTDCAVVVVRGQLDPSPLPPLRAAFSFACRDRAGDVVLDFEGVTFCGAETLRLVSDTSTRLSISGRHLSVRRALPRQARIFRICGLEHLLAENRPVAGR